jgi:hypothetical protein
MNRLHKAASLSLNAVLDAENGATNLGTLEARVSQLYIVAGASPAVIFAR